MCVSFFNMWKYCIWRCKRHYLIPCRLPARLVSTLLILACTSLAKCISLLFPTVFLSSCQLYFQTVARTGSTLLFLGHTLLALPGPASYVAFMAASANVPEMQSRCGQQAFPIYPMTHRPIII